MVFAPGLEHAAGALDQAPAGELAPAVELSRPGVDPDVVDAAEVLRHDGLFAERGRLAEYLHVGDAWGVALVAFLEEGPPGGFREELARVRLLVFVEREQRVDGVLAQPLLDPPGAPLAAAASAARFRD